MVQITEADVAAKVRGMDPSQLPGKRRYHGANVWFTREIIEDAAASEKEGRPVHVEIKTFNIQYPGHDHTARKIEPRDIQDYPEEYARFEAGNDNIVVTGTALEEWSMCPRTVARDLKSIGIHSVDQLAAVTDDVKAKIGTLQKYVKLAQKWLENAKSDQNVSTKLESQLEKANSRIKKLEEQNILLMKRVEASEGTRLHESH